MRQRNLNDSQAETITICRNRREREREKERASKQLRVRRPSNDTSNISDTCRCLATFGTFFYLQAAAHGSANSCRTCVTLANCNLTAKIWICVGFCVSSGQRTSVCSHVNCHCYCSVLIILSCTYCSSRYIYIYIFHTRDHKMRLLRELLDVFVDLTLFHEKATSAIRQL